MRACVIGDRNAESARIARCPRAALLHRGAKIDRMSGLTVDASHERSTLLAGQHHGPGGLGGWASRLVSSTLSDVGLRAEAFVRTSPEHAEQLVEARLFEQAVVLIDVDDDANGQASIDRLELLAARTWRDVTRGVGDVRPWLGAIRVINDSSTEALIVERLEHLVAFRLLDAACVVMVDQAAEDVWSSRPALSIESFKAALIGRCLVLGTLARPT